MEEDIVISTKKYNDGRVKEIIWKSGIEGFGITYHDKIVRTKNNKVCSECKRKIKKGEIILVWRVLKRDGNKEDNVWIKNCLECSFKIYSQYPSILKQIKDDYEKDLIINEL